MPSPERTERRVKAYRLLRRLRGGVGWRRPSLGPTLPGLAEQTHTALGAISLLFTAHALGYMLGSFLGGRLYDRIPGHPVMAAMLAAHGRHAGWRSRYCRRCGCWPRAWLLLGVAGGGAGRRRQHAAGLGLRPRGGAVHERPALFLRRRFLPRAADRGPSLELGGSECRGLLDAGAIGAAGVALAVRPAQSSARPPPRSRSGRDRGSSGGPQMWRLARGCWWGSLPCCCCCTWRPRRPSAAGSIPTLWPWT